MTTIDNSNVTTIAIIGLSFGGLSLLQELNVIMRDNPSLQQKLNVIVIEPKSAFEYIPNMWESIAINDIFSLNIKNDALVQDNDNNDIVLNKVQKTLEKKLNGYCIDYRSLSWILPNTTIVQGYVVGHESRDVQCTQTGSNGSGSGGMTLQRDKIYIQSANSKLFLTNHYLLKKQSDKQWIDYDIVYENNDNKLNGIIRLDYDILFNCSGSLSASPIKHIMSYTAEYIIQQMSLSALMQSKLPQQQQQQQQQLPTPTIKQKTTFINKEEEKEEKDAKCDMQHNIKLLDKTIDNDNDDDNTNIIINTNETTILTPIQSIYNKLYNFFFSLFSPFDDKAKTTNDDNGINKVIKQLESIIEQFPNPIRILAQSLPFLPYDYTNYLIIQMFPLFQWTQQHTIDDNDNADIYKQLKTITFICVVLRMTPQQLSANKCNINQNIIKYLVSNDNDNNNNESNLLLLFQETITQSQYDNIIEKDILCNINTNSIIHRYTEFFALREMMLYPFKREHYNNNTNDNNNNKNKTLFDFINNPNNNVNNNNNNNDRIINIYGAGLTGIEMYGSFADVFYNAFKYESDKYISPLELLSLQQKNKNNNITPKIILNIYATKKILSSCSQHVHDRAFNFFTSLNNPYITDYNIKLNIIENYQPTTPTDSINHIMENIFTTINIYAIGVIRMPIPTKIPQSSLGLQEEEEQQQHNITFLDLSQAERCLLSNESYKRLMMFLNNHAGGIDDIDNDINVIDNDINNNNSINTSSSSSNSNNDDILNNNNSSTNSNNSSNKSFIALCSKPSLVFVIGDAICNLSSTPLNARTARRTAKYALSNALLLLKYMYIDNFSSITEEKEQKQKQEENLILLSKQKKSYIKQLQILLSIYTPYGTRCNELYYIDIIKQRYDSNISTSSTSIKTTPTITNNKTSTTPTIINNKTTPRINNKDDNNDHNDQQQQHLSAISMGQFCGAMSSEKITADVPIIYDKMTHFVKYIVRMMIINTFRNGQQSLYKTFWDINEYNCLFLEFTLTCIVKTLNLLSWITPSSTTSSSSLSLEQIDNKDDNDNNNKDNKKKND